MEVRNFSNTYQAQLYKKPKQPSFEGLSSKLSKNVFEKSEVIKLYKKYRKKSKGKIGTLPASWIYSIPFEHRSQSIKNILQNFGEIFSELRKKKSNTTTKKLTAQKLTKLLKESGILKGRETAKIKYINSGQFADVYRLDVKKESYAIKLFHKLLEPNDSFHNINGNYFEQPLALFIKDKIPKRKNNWFKFYFGDLKNGIMVSRFENGNNPFNKKPFNVQKIGLITNIDEHYGKTNNIEGRIVDNGCTEIMEHAKNKTLRYVYKKTYSDQLAPFKIMKETLKWKPSPLKNERLKGVFYSLQIVSDENAKKCLDLLLPAADKEVSLYITQNIFYAPHKLRKEIFKAMYAQNDAQIDKMLTKRLEYIFGPIEQDTEAVKLLKRRNNSEINTLLKELYSV